MSKIAIFTGPQGHLSIAQAVESKLRSQHKVSLFYDRNFLFGLYKPIYQFVPGVNQIPFEISKVKRYQDAFYDMFKANYEQKITEFITQTKPDILISTYFMYNPSLDEFSQQSGTPFINVLPDPRTVHPLFISRLASHNLTFDDTATESCKNDQENKDSYITTGWFVKPAFEEKYDQAVVRKKLGLDRNLFTLLISSGSEGTTMVMKLLPLLMQIDKPIQVIIACGSNNTLLKSVNGFKTLLSRLRDNVSILPLGFVTNMHEYMQAADLVVGKAGPNSLFESVATLTPFFAVTHISGQEDGNLDIIRDYNVGFVEENPFKAQTLIQEIIDNPKVLESFQPSLKKLATHNKNSQQKLLQLIEKLTA
jgi:UDP-N-acetylglucosamine:LPS N-acetylglucosamine transferase